MRVLACHRLGISRVSPDTIQILSGVKLTKLVSLHRLDIKGIENVINYEMPRSIEIYLHRVGRTARAGKKGRYADPSRLSIEQCRAYSSLLSSGL